MGNKAVNFRKVMAGMFLVLVMVVLMGKNVSASSLTEMIQHNATEGERSLLRDVESVSDTVYTRMRSSHLNFGFVEIMKLSPTRAAIAATTQAHHVCPEIHMDVYVDKYDEDTGTWSYWRNWEYSTTNSDHLTKNMEIIVQSGYYYAVRGYHTCIHGNVMESAETITDGIYIGKTSTP